jgi:hypothetical protein
MKRIIPILFLAALVSSCVTSAPPQPWTTYSVSGIKIDVRPAARADLVKRFGNPSSAMNPFVDYPARLSGQSLLVFEVAIESPDYRVELINRQTTVAFEGAKDSYFTPAQVKALDAKALQDAWKVYIDGTSQVPELLAKTQKALPGNIVARPGIPASGYLVFLNKFPKGGTAVLSLAMEASNGDTGVIPLRVEIPEPGKKNTGIFAKPETEKPSSSGIFSGAEEPATP